MGEPTEPLTVEEASWHTPRSGGEPARFAPAINAIIGDSYPWADQDMVAIPFPQVVRIAQGVVRQLYACGYSINPPSPPVADRPVGEVEMSPEEREAGEEEWLDAQADLLGPTGLEDHDVVAWEIWNADLVIVPAASVDRVQELTRERDRLTESKEALIREVQRLQNRIATLMADPTDLQRSYYAACDARDKARADLDAAFNPAAADA